MDSRTNIFGAQIAGCYVTMRGPMKVKVKLFAMLRDCSPGSAVNGCVDLEVPEATTPHQIIDELKIPRDLTHLVLVNGVYLDPAQRDQASLKNGDTLAIWPPIAGG